MPKRRATSAICDGSSNLGPAYSTPGNSGTKGRSDSSFGNMKQINLPNLFRPLPGVGCRSSLNRSVMFQIIS